MKPAIIIVLFCLAMESQALAQQPVPAWSPAAPPPAATAGSASGDVPGSPLTAGAATVGNAPAVAPDSQEARELPLDSETFDVRVQRRVAEYSLRHEKRESNMASYDKATVRDPGLVRYADPRKVQVELSDELDRERTSEELSADYAEQAHDVQSKAQALQEFLAKRQQTVDELNKHQGSSRRQDLETAMANLARQPSSPETLAAMREIDQRLAETDRDENDLPAQLSQAQQETADASAELSKLQSLQQAYEKEAKTFTADALSARQNRLRLANKLEYFVVRAQAEDTLEQGRKSLEAAQHLAPSSEVQDLLKVPGSTTKSDTSLERMRGCINKSGDVQACRQATHQE
jgi:chromosome segregation ATPase